MRKIKAGHYEKNGYEIRIRDDEWPAADRGLWDLINPAGEWCQVFGRLRDAAAAVDEILAGE